jgi:hypothetical protein
MKTISLYLAVFRYLRACGFSRLSACRYLLANGANP